jgi:protease I
VTADNTEDLEFFYPYYRFIEAGYKVDVATPKGGDFKGKAGIGLKETSKIADANVGNYELLYLPGGKAPAELKKNPETITLVQKFFAAGKPIAAICHGPQILAAADIIKGQEIAAWPEVESAISDANATYVDKQVAMSGPFITARWPGDLPEFMKETLAMLEKGRKAMGPKGMAA